MIDIIQAIGAAAGAVVIAAFLYVNAFVKHRNEKTEEYLIEKYNAFGEEEHIDEVTKEKYEKSKSWYHGYTVALLALIVSAAFIGWFAPAVIGMKFSIPEELAPLISFIGAVVGGLFVDYFLLHPAADGLFFAKVEEPLLRAFLEPSAPEEVEEKAEEVEVPQEAEKPGDEDLIKAAELIISHLKK